MNTSKNNTSSEVSNSNEKKQEYQERYHFWTDKRITQLSFQNNILLTIGLAIIGYFWKERDSVYIDLIMDRSLKIDFTIVSFFAGILFVFVSVLIGVILSVSRLYDLRITSNIVLTRKRALKENVSIKDGQLLDSNFIKSFKSLMKLIFSYRKHKITYNDIRGQDAGLQDKFKKARQLSRDIGDLTWRLMNYQTTSLFIGIMFFILVLILK
ncbi:MAG: hypothetical protein ABIB41_02895 [Nitrospirota bacterium]